jgi:hypothetical protein
MKTAKLVTLRGRLGWILSLWLTASAVSIWGLVASAHAQLLPGDSLVIDANAGTNGEDSFGLLF